MEWYYCNFPGSSTQTGIKADSAVSAAKKFAYLESEEGVVDKKFVISVTTPNGTEILFEVSIEAVVTFRTREL